MDVVPGRASFIAPQTLQVASFDGHRRLSAEHMLIAVGTRPRQPRGAEPDGQTLITSDHLLNVTPRPRTLAVGGAGGIGIAYASMFAALGVQGTVIVT